MNVYFLFNFSMFLKLISTIIETLYREDLENFNKNIILFSLKPFLYVIL